MTALAWRLAHPASVHLVGFDGDFLIAQVNHYDAPDGPHWIGNIRNRAVTGRVATAEEAQRLVEEAWRG